MKKYLIVTLGLIILLFSTIGKIGFLYTAETPTVLGLCFGESKQNIKSAFFEANIQLDKEEGDLLYYNKSLVDVDNLRLIALRFYKDKLSDIYLYFFDINIRNYKYYTVVENRYKILKEILIKKYGKPNKEDSDPQRTTEPRLAKYFWRKRPVHVGYEVKCYTDWKNRNNMDIYLSLSYERYYAFLEYVFSSKLTNLNFELHYVYVPLNTLRDEENKKIQKKIQEENFKKEMQKF